MDIELGTLRIYLATCTTNPDITWVTQQARQFVWNLKDDAQDMAFLIYDNDTKFTASYDNVFSSEEIEILNTPYRAPRANAYAERWVRSIREECVSTQPWLLLKTTFTAFSESMETITTLPGRTRAQVNAFLYPGQ